MPDDALKGRNRARTRRARVRTKSGQPTRPVLCAGIVSVPTALKAAVRPIILINNHLSVAPRLARASVRDAFQYA